MLFFNDYIKDEFAHYLSREVSFIDGVKVYKFDVNINQELSEALEIIDTPTYIIFRNGEIVWRGSENVPVEYVREVIEVL